MHGVPIITWHKMQIFINNQAVEVAEGTNLEAILAANKLDAPGTAVAVDGRVVRRDARRDFILKQGAKVMVIKAACGG